jgi:molybdopterin molybdotransferase
VLTVEEALDRIRSAVGGPLPPEDVPLDDALGRVLAESVDAGIDLPPWDNSEMDGYAVHAADTAGASPASPVRLRVVGEVRAGETAPTRVPAGGAVRIATGAPLPQGADAVVPVEATLAAASSRTRAKASDPAPVFGFGPDEPLASECLVAEPASPGAHVRARGSDVKAGTRLLEPGAVMTPPQLGLAAAVGRARIRVHRRPVVGVLATGDELRDPGRDLGESGIFNANGPALMAACRAAGADAVDLGVAPDSLESVLSEIGLAFDSLDVLVVSGGVSVGPHDVVRSAFETLGRVDLWRIAVKPGKPFAFGCSHPRDDGRKVSMFGLPGNPVSTLVTFELFVRPAIRQLAGHRSSGLDLDRAVTADRLEGAGDRRAYLRVNVARGPGGTPLRDEHGWLRVGLAGGQGSHVLSAMAQADGLAIVPEGVPAVEAGGEVDLMWLAW